MGRLLGIKVVGVGVVGVHSMLPFTAWLLQWKLLVEASSPT